MFDKGENRRAMSAGFSESPVARPTLGTPASVRAAVMYSAVSLYSVKISTFSPACSLVSRSTKAFILESRVESQFPKRLRSVVMLALSLARSLRKVGLNTVVFTHLVLAGSDFLSVS